MSSSKEIEPISSLISLSTDQLINLEDVINRRTLIKLDEEQHPDEELVLVNTLAQLMVNQPLTNDPQVHQMIEYLPNLASRKGYGGLKKLINEWWELTNKLDEAIENRNITIKQIRRFRKLLDKLEHRFNSIKKFYVEWKWRRLERYCQTNKIKPDPEEDDKIICSYNGARELAIYMNSRGNNYHKSMTDTLDDLYESSRTRLLTLHFENEHKLSGIRQG